ncbi:MAG TPA: DUF4266 domain-containing protein [Puia sp.]|jgi:hypothetical protein|nr:DUF4266 domain-containing protein [Puia sp.]
MKFKSRNLITVVFVSFVSCRTVKPYQRAYLNDNAMQINKKNIDKLSSDMHSYKEGASGGGRGKSSGGCGCN